MCGQPRKIKGRNLKVREYSPEWERECEFSFLKLKGGLAYTYWVTKGGGAERRGLDWGEGEV